MRIICAALASTACSVILAAALYGQSSTNTNATAVGEFYRARNHFNEGTYQSALRSGLNGLDLVCQKVASLLYGYIPDLSNYTVIDTNFYYTVSDENGNMNISATVYKVFSNTNAALAQTNSLLTVTLDTAVHNVDRYYNLEKSFDFLTEKGDYRKFAITNKARRGGFNFIFENNTVYLALVFEMENDEILSGVLVKSDFVFPVKMTYKERQAFCRATLKELVDKLQVSSMGWYLK